MRDNIMKIGIVTYYDAINEGAFLQAYNLKSFLMDIYTDAELYFINFKLTNHKRLQYKQFFNTKDPRKIINSLKRIRALSAAQKEYFSVTSDIRFDLIVIGSDEMWNVTNPLFSEENLGIGLICDNICTYAISMGNSSANADKYLQVRDKLDNIKFISVRDENSEYIVNNVFNRTARLHLDPVFLKELPAKTFHHTPKYIMIYGGISDKNIISEILRLANELRLEVLSVDIYNKWTKNIVAKSPWEFLGIIDSAELVITNMFHGTMLSISRKKKFVTIITPEREKKIIYTLKLFCCLDRAAHNKENLSEILHNGLNDLNEEYIDRIIGEERKKSETYLKFAEGYIEKHE